MVGYLMTNVATGVVCRTPLEEDRFDTRFKKIIVKLWPFYGGRPGGLRLSQRDDHV
jgi:hypothetical protein